MAKPEEFTIHIEPDGRIILNEETMRTVSMKELLQLLEETVGPSHVIELAPEDPPTRHLSDKKAKEKTKGKYQRIDRR